MAVIKPFHISDKNIVINISFLICDTSLKLLDSDGFSLVVSKYLSSIDQHAQSELQVFKKQVSSPKQLIDIYKSLVMFPYKEVIEKSEKDRSLLSLRKEFYVFTEELYDYWRHFERYGIIQKKLKSITEDNESLIDMTEILSKTILSVYRKITKNISGKSIQVYRQTPAGLNAGLIVSKGFWKQPLAYSNLEGIDVIDTVMLRTPFIGHSVMNTRSGLFKESFENPLPHMKLTQRHWLCYPIKVGTLLAYVYFHRDYLNHGVALSNLFETVPIKDHNKRSPNLVFVFGDTLEEYDNTYYHDQTNDIYIGYVSRNQKNDYFGYMKKMLLTLHNVYMIDHFRLPIHGAMVSITLENNQKKNIAIIGDSGAGKSETLESLRFVGEKSIKELVTVFDDMGVFYFEGDQVYAVGTETGAFVRLDDLENGYAYKEIDRAFFLNPERVNARVILPVTSYETVITPHKVDICLYANNFEDLENPIRLFHNAEEALQVFREGKRKAKGTTSESGIVTSFFANPFGCVQKQAQTEVLLQKTFQVLFEQGIVVGELYTKLAVSGKEHSGVNEAAKALLEIIVLK
ncbi:MAG: phosphoenolpyruvate carboxykinase [Firmicutes bacterium]|nr:phosphoenolpyruvate carboxykinase [Bacillota bacterium]